MIFFNKSSIFSYLLAFVLLALAVYSHDIVNPQKYPFEAEKNIALLLLSACMLAVDWSVKQRYWATKANHHLVIFSLFVYVLPIENWNNWLLLFFFFFWIGFNYLVGIDQSSRQIRKTFNAAFFIFLGSLFYPSGLFFFPLLWVVLLLQGRLNFRTIVISLLPVLSVFLLEVVFTFFFPQSNLIMRPSFEGMGFKLLWEIPIRLNLWWLLLLLLLFFSLLRHYIDMSAKSATYGIGIFALLATAITTIGFVLFFQTQDQLAWVLIIMVVAALSTRFFEEIKSGWLRELLFVLLLSLLLFGKYGYPF